MVDPWQPEPLLGRNRCLKMVTNTEDTTFWLTNRPLSTHPPFADCWQTEPLLWRSRCPKMVTGTEATTFRLTNLPLLTHQPLSTAGNQNHSSFETGVKMVTEPKTPPFWLTNRPLPTHPPRLTPDNQNHSSGAAGVPKWSLGPRPPPFGSPTAGNQNYSRVRFGYVETSPGSVSAIQGL